jgi:hypothetical protein
MTSASTIETDDGGRRIPWGLIAILVLAAVLRLSRLDLVAMTNAMAGDGLTANLLVASTPDTGWPLAGSLVEGVRGSSLFIYLLSLPNQLVWHPLTGVVLVAVLNIWAVYLAYRLAGRLFGRRAGFAAGLLLACSPWAVVYSRQMWSGSCLGLVSLWLVGLSLTWLSQGGSGRLIRMLILGFLLPQIHFSGLVATAWLAVVIWIGRQRVGWLAVITGACFGLSTWTPWVAFHHIGDWVEFRDTLSILGGKSNLLGSILDEINTLQSLLHSGNFAYWFAANPQDLPQYFPGWQRALVSASGLLMIVTAAASCFVAPKALRARAADSEAPRPQHDIRLLWLWIVLPLLGGLIYHPEVRPEHLLIALPVLVLLAASTIGRFLDANRKPTRILAGGLLATIAASHVLFLSSWNNFLDDDLAKPQGQYGLTFRQRRDVARWVLRDCDPQSVELAGPIQGGHPAYEYVYYYERSQAGRDREEPQQDVKYWIDEESDAGQLGTVVHRNLKQRQIGAILNRYQSRSPRWKIEKSHKLGATRIYRIRLPASESFKMTSHQPVRKSQAPYGPATGSFEQRSWQQISRLDWMTWSRITATRLHVPSG